MSLLRVNVVTSTSGGESDDELDLVDGDGGGGSGGGGGAKLAWKKMAEKIHPAYAVEVGTDYVGKVFKGTKARHHWVFVLPEDAVDKKVELPLDARTTKIDLVHSTMSGRIEVFVNDELSASSMMRNPSDSVWKLAKRDSHSLSPIIFDAQAAFKGHTVRVTIKNASEQQFQVRGG